MTDQAYADEGSCYAFDSRGYILRSGFLPTEKVQRAREAMAELSLTQDAWNPDQRRSLNIHRANTYLAELARSLFQAPLTRALINYPHRLLESYALMRTRGALDLHGGASEFLAETDIHDHSAQAAILAGRPYALRIKVLIYLDDVRAKPDGRFTYVEGSHKAGLSFHRAFPRGRRDALHLTRTVEVRAGDAIWLNEALLHGAEAKTSDTRRRLLAYTFGPTFMASWSELSDDESLERSGYAASESENSRDRAV